MPTSAEYGKGIAEFGRLIQFRNWRVWSVHQVTTWVNGPATLNPGTDGQTET